MWKFLECEPFNSFANEKIDISINKSVIDTTASWYFDNYMFWKTYDIFSMYSLYKINFPDFVKINEYESDIYVNWWGYVDTILKLNKRPLILDYLIKKSGIDKIKKLMDNWVLLVIWRYNTVKTLDANKSSDFYLNKDKEWVELKFLHINNKYSVYNSGDEKIKLVINPFNEAVYKGYDYLNGGNPEPILSIFDNSLLPQNLKLKVNSKVYYPKIKYSLQKYNKAVYSSITQKQIGSHIVYVFIPSYELDIELPKWQSIIDLSYLKYNVLNLPLEFNL